LVSEAKIEQFDSKWNFPWQKSTIQFEIDSNDKKIAAANYRIKIANLQQKHFKNIIIYLDGSKLNELKAGAGSYISYSYCK
jgi:hypothetical protein